MPAQRLDLIVNNPDGNAAVEQGATFDLVITLRTSPGGALMDLTGYSAEMKIKRHSDHATTLASWSSSGGQIVMGGTAGTITFAVSDTDTAALDWLGLARYDLFIESMSGTRDCVYFGNVELYRRITD